MPIPTMSFQATSLSKMSNSDTSPSSMMPPPPPVPRLGGEHWRSPCSGRPCPACLPDDGATVPTKETTEAVEKAAHGLRALGANVVETPPPRMEQAQDIWLFNMLHLAAGMDKYYPRESAELTGSTLADKTSLHYRIWHGMAGGLKTETKFGPHRLMDDLAPATVS